MYHENDLFYHRYRLLESFGRGGFSVVWKAYDEKSKTLVALKIFMKQDREGVELCRQEYGKAHDLIHQHIVRPFFFDEFREAPFLVMPFYQKGTTAALAGNIAEAELAKIMAQIGSALGYLHTRTNAVLHNDIKPDNLLVSDDGDYLLSDFGISGPLQHKLTQTIGGFSAGVSHSAQSGVTPVAYRAPELFPMKNFPKQDPSTASDIWAFGACLYHLAKGEPPFGGQGGLSQRINMASGNVELSELLEDLPSHFSENLNNWIMACLSLNASERPAARQLAGAAQAFQRTGVWPQPPMPVVQMAEAQPHFAQSTRDDAALSTNTPVFQPKKQKPGREQQRLPVWVWALGALLMCAAGFAVFKTNQNSTCQRLLAEADDLFQKKEYQLAREKYAEARECDPFNESLSEKIKRSDVLAKIQTYPFSFPGGEGLEAVADTVAGRLRWGYLDTLTGALVIPLRYDSVSPFQNGQAVAWKFDRRYEIGKDGKELNPSGSRQANVIVPPKPEPLPEPAPAFEPTPAKTEKILASEKVDFEMSEPTVYAGEEVKFTDRFTAAFDKKIKSWDFGDGGKLNSSKKTVAHSFKKPGKYQVQLCVTNQIRDCETRQVTVLAANLDLGRKATTGLGEKERNLCAAPGREVAWKSGDASITITPQTVVELQSAVLYGDVGGKVKISISDGNGAAASVTRYVVRGRSPLNLEDLAFTLESGKRYTLTVSPLRDADGKAPRLENAAACGNSGFKDRNLAVDYGGNGILFDLSYRF